MLMHTLNGRRSIMNCDHCDDCMILLYAEFFGQTFYLACMCERLRLCRRYLNFSVPFNETFVVSTNRNKWIIRNYILGDLLGVQCTQNGYYLINSLTKNKKKKLIHCMSFFECLAVEWVCVQCSRLWPLHTFKPA